MRKLLSTAVAFGVIASVNAPLLAAVDPGQLPVLSTATGSIENAAISYPTATQMTVTIGSDAANAAGNAFDVGSLQWSSYNIGADATVNYEFTNHHQTAINRVEATGGVSQIYGHITQSGCLTCGYEDTSKIILINPNGVIFNNGSTVNVNSFTVSDMNGTYYKDAATNLYNLKLDTPSEDGSYGIVVDEGADIYGKKGVVFASDKNITLYSGSRISTSTLPTGVTTSTANKAYGRVKLITADGVNFTYYNNGGIGTSSDFVESDNKMVIQLNGTIEANHIDVRNYSNYAGTATDKASEINLNGAILKATKAEYGADGSIWLVSNKDITIGNTTGIDTTEITTLNADGAGASAGGDILISAGNKLSVTADIDAVGKIDLLAANGDVVVDKSTVDALGSITISSTQGGAAAQNNSVLTAGGDLSITGLKTAQLVNSSANSINFTLKSTDTDVITYAKDSTVAATNNILVESTNGSIYLDTTNFGTTAKKIELISRNDISTALLNASTGTADNISIESTAGNIKLSEVNDNFKQNTGKVAYKADKNIEIVTDTADLTIGKNATYEAKKDLIIKNSGNISLTADDATGFIPNTPENIYIISDNGNLTTANDSEYAINLHKVKTYLYAENGKIDVVLSNANEITKGLVAKSGSDMKIKTVVDKVNSDSRRLSVSSLISGGDLTLDTRGIFAGQNYTNNGYATEGDSTDRSYIEVHGTFNGLESIAGYNYESGRDYKEVTDDEGTTTAYNQRHYITVNPDSTQYSDQKILLVTDLVTPTKQGVTPPTIVTPPSATDTEITSIGSLPANIETPTLPAFPTTPTIPSNPSSGDPSNPSGDEPSNPSGGDSETCPNDGTQAEDGDIEDTI